MAVGKFLEKSQIEKINSIVQRLEGSVDELKIRNWLEQFKFEDWDKALEVLSKLEYYSTKRIIQEINEGLNSVYSNIEKIENDEANKFKIDPTLSKLERQKNKHQRKLRKKGNNKVLIHPLGKFGKSGSMMSYYVTHAPFFKKSRFFLLENINEIVVKNKNKCLHLVIFDDFSGSGKSLDDYIESFVIPQLQKKKIVKIKIHMLCVVYMKKAKDFIYKKRNNYVKFYGTVRVAAFSSEGSPFGYRPKMLTVREFCYEYGKNLYTKVDYSYGTKIENDYPLGYKNTQALIVFSHTVPNNTLPIIWSTQNDWMPLYPRVMQARINEIIEFKNQTRIWLSVSKGLGYEKLLGKDSDRYSSENIKLICYIRLLKKGHIKPVISQKLNLTKYELDNVICNGIERGVLQDEDRLSGYGEELYLAILKKMQFIKKRNNEPQKEIIYIPKSFRGKA